MSQKHVKKEVSLDLYSSFPQEQMIQSPVDSSNTIGFKSSHAQEYGKLKDINSKTTT